jgi:hypothetical protein
MVSLEDGFHHVRRDLLSNSLARLADFWKLFQDNVTSSALLQLRTPDSLAFLLLYGLVFKNCLEFHLQ